MAPHSSTLAWKIPWTEEPGGATVQGVTESWTRLSDLTSSLTLAIVCLWGSSHPCGSEMVSHCGFDLHFLND